MKAYVAVTDPRLYRFLRARPAQLAVGALGVATLGAFLVIHVAKDLRSDVDARERDVRDGHEDRERQRVVGQAGGDGSARFATESHELC